MLKTLKKKNKKGQSVLEYIILIIIVITALLIMQSYMARGTSSGLRQSTDQISEMQFQPGNTNFTYTRSTERTVNERATQAGSSQTMDPDNPEVITERTDSRILNAEQMFWGVTE